MNALQTIAKNAGFLFVSETITKVSGFFYIMYMARYLGAERYGILTFAIAFAGIFGVFADLGLQQLTIREVARDKALASKYLGNIIIIKIILSILTFGLIAEIVNLLNYSQTTVRIVYLISLSVIFTGFTGIFNSIFQAFEKMEYSSIGAISNSLLMLVSILIAIKYNFDITGFAYIYFINSILIYIYSLLISIWKFPQAKLEFDPQFWRYALNEALPFGISGVFIMIYSGIGSIMLSYMKGNEVVGWYSVSSNLVFILLVVPLMANTVLFPVMSRFYASSKNALRVIVEKYFKYMLVIIVPIAIGTTLLADKIIISIYGEGYAQSVPALRILIWATVFTFSNAAFVRLLQSINKQIIVTRITGICMIENIILNLLIIPQFSYIGASVSAVITEFTVAALALGLAFNIGWGIRIVDLLSNLLKIAISSAIMGIFVWFFRDINLSILIFSAAILYFLSLYAINGFDKDDTIIFRAMVRRKEN